MMLTPRFSSTNPQLALQPARTSTAMGTVETLTPSLDATSPKESEPFFTPLPREYGPVRSVATWLFEAMFPAWSLSEDEQRVAELLDHLKEGLDNGTLKPTGEPVKITKKRTSRSYVDETHELSLMDAEGRQFTLEVTYDVEVYIETENIRKSKLKKVNLKGQESGNSLVLDHRLFGHVIYHEKQAEMNIFSDNRHLVNRKNRPLALRLVKLLKTTLKAQKDAEQTRIRMANLRTQAQKRQKLPNTLKL